MPILYTPNIMQRCLSEKGLQVGRIETALLRSVHTVPLHHRPRRTSKDKEDSTKDADCAGRKADIVHKKSK